MTAQHPCVSCGICCDGTLFDHVLLDPELDARPSEHLNLVDIAGRPGFRQPCQHSSDQGCSIYNDRPHLCRKFRCATLEAFERQEIGIEVVRKRIDDALAARARAIRLCEPAMSLQEIRKMVLADQGVADAIPAQLKLALGVLEILLDRHFRKNDDRAMQAC